MYSYLAVTSPRIVSGDDGRVRDAFSFGRALEQEGMHIASYFWDHRVPRIPDRVLFGQAEIHYPVTKAGLNRFPLSPFHSVHSLDLYDSEGAKIQLRGGLLVRECIAGAFEVELPDLAVAEVRYRIEEKKYRFLSATTEQLDSHLPVIKTYEPSSSLRLISGLLRARDSLALKAKILYDFIVGQEFYGANDAEVADLINNSGAVRSEVIAALGSANCLPFAYHVVVQLRKVGVPVFIIGGDIPISSSQNFQVNPGHAQVLAVLPEGLCVFDLTNNLRKDRIVDCSLISADTWEQTIQDFKHQTRKEAFDSVRAIRNKILKDRTSVRSGLLVDMERSSSEPGSFAGVEHLSGGSFRNAFSNSSELTETFSTDPRIQALQKSMLVKPYFAELFRLLEEGKQKADISEAINFVDSEEAPPVLLDRDLEYLGSSYRSLCHLSPTDLMKRVALELIETEGTPQTLVSQAADWLALIYIPNTYLDMRRDGGPGYHGPTYNRLSYSLRDLIKENPAGRFISGLSDHTLIRVIKSYAQGYVSELGNRYTEANTFPAKAPPRYHKNSHLISAHSTLVTSHNLLSGLVEELVSRNPSGFEAQYLDFAALLGTVAVDLENAKLYVSSFDIEWGRKELSDSELDSLHVQICRNLNLTTLTILKLGSVSLEEKLFKIFHTYEDTWRRGIGRYCLSYLDREYFDEETRYALNARMSELLASSLIAEDQIPDIERTVRRMAEANITLNLERWQASIEPVILERVSKSHGFGRASVNFPTEDNPASRIIVELSIDPDAALLRSLETLYRIGGLTSLSGVSDIWPRQPEEEVAARLVRELSIGSSYSGQCRIQYMEKQFDGASFHLGDSMSLLEEGLSGRPLSLQILRLMRNRGYFGNSIEKSFQDLKVSFPSAWQRLIVNLYPEIDESDEFFVKMSKMKNRAHCASELIVRLSRDIDPQDAYPAILGIAAGRI
ncbi:MAG: hypothetical protein KDD42_06095, partial [Bdellovibrionales bacterium]|nr:hypothetical protein [Bdellovibrionales bacterium]